MRDINELFFNHATENENSSIDEEMIRAMVHGFSCINGTSTFVIDFDSHQLIYKSEHLEYIDESTNNDIKRECTNPYWRLISNKTTEELLCIRDNYILPGNEMSEEDFQHHICVIDYPIILHGKEWFITQKFIPLLMRKDGITRIGMFTINHSTKTKVESVIIAPSGKRFIFDASEKRFVPFDASNRLTKTEIVVLRRAKMGMKRDEIADSLEMSANTVKRHFQNIFDKLNVNNLSEALSVAINYSFF